MIYGIILILGGLHFNSPPTYGVGLGLLIYSIIKDIVLDWKEDQEPKRKAELKDSDFIKPLNKLTDKEFENLVDQWNKDNPHK